MTQDELSASGGSEAARTRQGLSSAQAARLLQQYGPNRLPDPPAPGPFQIFLRQFLSPFIYILLIAAVASLWLQQIPNAIFILAVLMLNAVIGTLQEYSAQKSAAALRNLVKGHARVLRDGQPVTLDVEQLVPGDHVLLASGDKVPADIRLSGALELAVDESMLTGESLAVAKSPVDQDRSERPLNERTGECFAGTIVTHGRASGTVTATGENTELGKIAGQVTSDTGGEPPLMLRIRRFTLQVAAGIILSILLLVGIMAWEGGYSGTAMAIMAIGLAVSAIPEGLPAALTVALAIGMRRMADRNVIIRKLVAVEALGSCTLICSDKTGTLTVNELTIRKLMMPDGSSCSVSGEGIAPGGSVENAEREDVLMLAETGVLANESHLDYAGGDWVSDGDIVDVAFLVLAKKLGLSLRELQRRQQQLSLIPYESENAYAASVNRLGEDIWIHVKGSPEKILAMCDRMWVQGEARPIDPNLIEQQFLEAANNGYRIIALARRQATQHSDKPEMQGMLFLGMVAMIDPVRADVPEAVRRCQSGGIEVAMITGDHPATARAIAIEIGLCDIDSPVITGADIHRMQSDAELDSAVGDCRVFARIEPDQKRRLVDSFARQGHFVAVTGDGVNDAPALRRAHAGVAMGKRGTDVAKETADLIITDDHFASIVEGIEQGRIVYNNIRKVVGLLIATGFSAILLFFLCVAFGLPMPLLATQLLWLNLVANGLQDVALAFEPKEGHELEQKPRNPSEPIFERHIIEHVLITGTTMGLLAFAVFSWLYESGMAIETVRNLTLMVMVLFGNIHALSSRSESRSLFRIPLLGNPFLICAVPIAQLVHIGATYAPGLGGVLQLQPVSVHQWLTLLGVAGVLLMVEEIHKWTIRKRQTSGAEHT